MNEHMSQEDFELACAECEGVKVSTIKAWRKSTGGYSNEKIDDMYLGYSLATVALEKQKAITRRVSAESNRLFDEKAVLIKQLEAAERERDELRAELARRDAAAGERVATHLIYSSVLPKFIGDTDEVESYSCFISGKTPPRKTMEEAYSDAYQVCGPLYTAAPPAVLPDIDGYTHGLFPHAVEQLTRFRDDALALGAQQQKVVELPEPVKWPEVPYRYFSEDQVFSMLNSANVKWEVKK